MTDPKRQNPPVHTTEPSVAYRVLGGMLSIWRRIENIAFGFILVLIALYFILQSSWVQNWLIGRITQYFSNELHTTVSIGHVDIAFFDNLALEQVFIADQHGDTLIFAGQISAGLKNNFFSAMFNKLEFNELTLSNAQINLRRYEGEYQFNYQFLADYFGGNNNTAPKKKTPFSVKVRNLRLDNIVLVQNNTVRGERMEMRIPKCIAQINHLDAPSKLLDIESIILTGITFDLEETPGSPMPPRPKPVSQTTSTGDSAGTPKEHKPFLFNINHFQLVDGHFFMDRFQKSPAKTTPESVLDLNHIAVNSIGFEADSVQFNSNWSFAGQLKKFCATEQSGLTILHAAARQVVVNDTLTGLYGAAVETGQMAISDTILLSYGAYRDLFRFNNNVRFDLRLKPGSYLEPGEFGHFSEDLANNDFIVKNQHLRTEISGQIRGKLNRIDARDMIAKIGNSTFVQFDFDGEDLTRGNDVMRMEFDFKRLQSDIGSLRKIIPGFKPPSNFEKLGAFNFTGTYNLLFGSNHILNGAVKSDIGYGELDMKLDMTPGREKATYSGKLDMHNFDIGIFTGNKALGKSAFNVTIKEGSHGFKISTMEARLEGRIDTLEFKNYRYTGVKLDGTISESLFAGELDINDPNLRFNFSGTVNLKKEIPEYKFTADLKRIDLKKLHFSNEDLIISAKADNVLLTGKNISDLAGIASVRQVQIIQTIGDSIYRHRIDSVRFESNFQAQDYRHFALRSDILSLNVDGRFNLSRVPRNLQLLFSKYYPVFASQFNLQPYNDSIQVRDLYRFGLYIKNTKNLTKLIDRQLDTISNVAINGQVDAQNGISELRAEIPIIRYGNTEIRKSVFNWRSEKSIAGMVIQLPDTKLSKGYHLSPVFLTGNIKNDQVKFALQTKDTTSIIQSVDLKGIISVVDSLWQIKFNASKFDLFNQGWAIEEDNYLRFGNQYIDTKNFELMNGLRRIWLDSQNKGRGIKLTCSNFDLSFINEILPTRDLTYRGNMSDFDIVVEDVFRMEHIKIFLATDTVFVNNLPYGRVDGNIEIANLQAPLEWQIVSRDEALHLSTSGAWHFGGKSSPEYNSAYVPRPLKPGQIYAKIDGSNFPLNIVQQFVPGISGTEGRFDIQNILEGKIGGGTEIGLDGVAKVREGQFTIDYLNTPFYMKNQRIILTDDRIWMAETNGDTIYDATRRNIAIVKGGLRHHLFRKWKIEAEVASVGNNFLLLDTKKTEDALYYGKGIGSFRAAFSGNFARTNIKVDVTTGANTKMYIPLTSENEAREVNFINFKPKNSLLTTAQNPLGRVIKKFQASDLKGLDIEMNLRMTEQAEVQLIFDEKAGDILSGRGDGLISILLNREGEFKMNGNYTIRKGEYLFTLPVIFVNKPFTVANGGKISWFGDPYGAQIDIDATYSETTSVYNLIQDELAIVGNSSNIVQEANKSTQVNVDMRLYGDLFKPSIDFGLSFPNITGSLKGFTDNKMRLLAQDQNEINRQVFGLIVFGTFLPPNEFAPVAGANAVSSAAVSTVTQFLGSQLSNYLTGIASEFFGGSVSSIDFDISYKDNTSALNLGTSELISNRDVQFRFRSGFANDRITIQIGSQFGVANNATTDNGFQGEDVVVEIQPLENRQWRVRAYQRIEPDLFNNGLNKRYGLGLSFRRDFDNFDELMKGVSGWWKKNK